MTLSFSTPITALPSTTPFTLSTTGGSCLGGGTATVTTSLGSVALDADCEMVVTVTSGSLSVPGGQAPVTVIGAGPSLLQSWTFIDTATVGALEATGVFAWVDAPQIEGCLLVGTSSMTLSGELVAVP